MKGDQMEEIKLKQYLHDSFQLLTVEVGNDMFRGEKKVKIEKIQIHVWTEGSDQPVIVDADLAKFGGIPQLCDLMDQEEKGERQ